MIEMNKDEGVSGNCVGCRQSEASKVQMLLFDVGESKEVVDELAKLPHTLSVDKSMYLVVDPADRL